MEEFIKMVDEMRKAQKEYFRTRDYAALFSSKILEKKVDEWIKLHSDKEQTLF